ncbi:MAG: beta-propeller fold lactonase family protein, partial [Planctomycetota bacterium]
MRLLMLSLLLTALMMGCSNGGGGDNFVPAQQVFNSFPSQSGVAQIHPSDQVVYVANFEADSMTAVQVRSGGLDSFLVLAEIPVGNEPRSLSISPTGSTAYVSNGADNTVSVVNLGGGFGPYYVEEDISVGSEPRGTALSPSGRTLYVANFADGTVSVIDTFTNDVTATISLGTNAHPYAVTVTNDLDGSDSDETVYVSNFFARARAGVLPDFIEGFNDGKEGFLFAIDSSTNGVLGTISLSPRASGFSADRTLYCVGSTPPAVNDTYCVDTATPGGNGDAAVPQDAFPNQLYSIAIDPDTDKLYIPSIAASPEPPLRFNTNFQAYVSVIDTLTDSEITAEGVNLNSEIATENGGVATTPPSLVRVFASDITSMSIREGVALIPSRGGSFAFKATFNTSGVLTLTPPTVVRFKTGNIPTGVILNSTGTRGYVYAEVDATLTAIDLVSNTNIAEIDTAILPSPGSNEHNIILGKLVFFTGMGVSVNPLDDPAGLVGRDVRTIDTSLFRGIASNDNWSSCGSCHPDGLADGVTWIFDTGPRQTISLDGSYAPQTPENQRVFNWNAVRGSVTDFNNNTRGVQGGLGFTPLPGPTDGSAPGDEGTVFNHGPNQGVSEALDLMTLWVQAGIRIFNRPTNLSSSVSTGSSLFSINISASRTCVECHGGPK